MLPRPRTSTSAAVRDPAAAPVFEKLSRDEATDKNVRDAARRALALLRSPAQENSPTVQTAASARKLA